MRVRSKWLAFVAVAWVACDQGHPSLTVDVAATPPRRLRRLSSREYNNVVRDLLGDTTRPANRFVADVYPNGFDNGAALLAVQSEQVADYAAAAASLAAGAVADRFDALVGGCDLGRVSIDACVDRFLDGFAARAYRRPLTPSEAARLRALIVADAGGLRRGVQTALEVMLQSPQFLYREELGAPGVPAVAGAMTKMTPYEVASQLSFLLTGSIPDDELWRAVAQHRFEGPGDYRREAERLLRTPAARESMRAFLHQWLATDKLAATTKDATFYADFDPALASSMKAELDALFDDVLWYGDGSLRELLTRDVASVDARLAAVYGVRSPADGTRRAAALDARTRRGVLTRAGFLAVHADHDSSGPIARGVFVLKSIVCAPPPPRPQNVPQPPPPADPGSDGPTTRQRFAMHASDPFCARCHRAIDGIGFAFEEYDGIGRFRAVENGQRVDAGGELYGLGRLDGKVADAADLASRLAGARRVGDCFTRQLYRWAMGSVEPDGDALGWLADRFSTDARITDLIVTLVTTPQFVNRRFEASP